MGFLTVIDVIGSTIIGGFLLLILFRLNDNAAQNSYNFSGELTVQENLVATIEVLEYDFRKIGYAKNPLNLPNPSRTIIYADTSDIRFLVDADFDGDVDTMRYYLGPTSGLPGTPNPRDRMLYRSINGVAKGVNLGITKFKITYFNVLEQVIPTPITFVPTGIQAMQIDITVENTAARNNDYRNAFWRQIRLASRNLDNR